MTREDCIAKINALDLEHNCSAEEFIYDELYEIVMEYDPHLEYFFDGYHKEDYVYQSILDNSPTLEEIADRMSNITEFTGMYYFGDYGWETADLYQLRDSILDELEWEENEPGDRIEEIWVEEEDNFLTEEKR